MAVDAAEVGQIHQTTSLPFHHHSPRHPNQTNQPVTLLPKRCLPTFVLMTGVTGHLGFRTLHYALKAGYSVRAVVRSEKKASAIRSNPALQAAFGSEILQKKLEFVEVPDFLAPHAFHEAVRGVQYIIHCAAPLGTGSPPNADADEYFIKPSVRGTLAVFEAAAATTGVKRVVVTSSIAALLPPHYFANRSGTEAAMTAESRFPVADKADMTSNFDKYQAAKSTALQEVEKWIAAQNPEFDAIHIHPGYIFGRDDLCESVEDFQTGTNSVPLNLALGRTKPGAEAMFNYVHLNDVASSHVKALDSQVSGGQSFILSSDGQSGESFDDQSAIVEKHFPEAVKEGVFPNDGRYKSNVAKFDVRKSEETFGKLRSYEECVVSVLGHYLELVSRG